MNIDISAMLGNVGIYLGIISALALSTERIMDAIKFFAKKNLARDQQAESTDQKKEGARKRRVRIIAIPIALCLAWLARVDTFQILGLSSPLWFDIPILGYILSGLAASRGSAFWHDVIELVTKAKEAKKDLVAATTNPVGGS